MTHADRTVHLVVPEGVDDVTRPSGGNVYDRRLRAGLAGIGWTVHQHEVPGRWPHPDPADLDALVAALRALPSGDTALVDGLVASAAPEVISRYAARVRLVVLVHLPLGVASLSRRRAEGAMLSRVAGVVATSAWTRSWVVDHYGVAAERIRVAVPGADPAPVAPGSATGTALLCVGAVTRDKGHDLLLDALAAITTLPWTCACVGSLEVDRAFASSLRHRSEDGALAGRVTFTGTLHGADLDAAYRAADVLVLPSRVETYGMVVTEALAHGLPVIATRAGGVPEAFGGRGGTGPGLLVPPEDAHALAAALRAWLEDSGLRARARRAAQERRRSLPTWSATAAEVATALAGRAPS